MNENNNTETIYGPNTALVEDFIAKISYLTKEQIEKLAAAWDAAWAAAWDAAWDAARGAAWAAAWDAARGAAQDAARGAARAAAWDAARGAAWDAARGAAWAAAWDAARACEEYAIALVVQDLTDKGNLADCHLALLTYAWDVAIDEREVNLALVAANINVKTATTALSKAMQAREEVISNG